MAKLRITSNQETVINNVNTPLEDAFNDGVDTISNPSVLPPINLYNTLTSTNKTKVKNPFQSLLAAIMSTLNIPRELPATKFTGTITYVESVVPLVTKTITVIDGIITSVT